MSFIEDTKTEFRYAQRLDRSVTADVMDLLERHTRINTEENQQRYAMEFMAIADAMHDLRSALMHFAQSVREGNPRPYTGDLDIIPAAGEA